MAAAKKTTSGRVTPSKKAALRSVPRPPDGEIEQDGPQQVEPLPDEQFDVRVVLRTAHQKYTGIIAQLTEELSIATGIIEGYRERTRAAAEVKAARTKPRR